jgi:hypothetical protein
MLVRVRLVAALGAGIGRMIGGDLGGFSSTAIGAGLGGLRVDLVNTGPLTIVTGLF